MAHRDAVPDAETAFAVQHAVGTALGWWGANELPPVWKSGGPSRTAVMKHAGLPTPAVRQARAADETLSLADRPWHGPILESEIALRLGQAVTPAQAATLTPEQARFLVDALAVAVEVVDCRWAERADAPPLLQLADGQWHGALALGPWLPWNPSHDWATQSCRLTVAGAEVHRTGSHPLGEPAWLLPVWLRHLTRHGATVPAGTVVTTGNWTGATPWPADSVADVVFDGLGRLRVGR